MTPNFAQNKIFAIYETYGAPKHSDWQLKSQMIKSRINKKALRRRSVS